MQIRGHSLGALFDNWLVFYDDVRNPPDDDLVGRMCVCGLADGRVLIKALKRSQIAGLWTFSPTPSRRSTTSGSTGRRWCAKCGRDSEEVIGLGPLLPVREKGAPPPRLIASSAALPARSRYARSLSPVDAGQAGTVPAKRGSARRDAAHAAQVMPSPALRARDRARADPLSLGDAGRRGALPYLRDLLDAGRICRRARRVRGAGDAGDRQSLCALRSGRPNLAFAGHTDVVPPGDAARWRFDPFAAEIADGQLWGRGACDMKGGVAAAVAAALRFVARGAFSGSISFLVTGDEEGPAVNGTVKLLDWALARGERFDHCVLGEPTSVSALGDTIKNGRRGSLTGRLTIHGRQGHVAYPHLADNPIRALAPVLDGAASRRRSIGGTPTFEPSNLEIVSVDVGNPAANVIPGEVRLVFNIRFNDRWTPRDRSRPKSRGGSRRRRAARARR